MTQRETHPLDYRSVSPDERVRPRVWLSHMRTAAVLCVIALFVDRRLRFDWGDTRGVVQIEVALALYGATCAVVCMLHGALRKGDWLAVVACPPLFLFTAYVGLLMPRLNRN